MKESLAIEAERAEPAEMKAAIDEIFDEIGRVNLRMQQNRSEIRRLRAETRSILLELKSSA